MSAAIEEKTRPVPSEPGDHDRFSHYFDKQQMTLSLVEGVPVPAVCGKIMVVTRDGEPFPVCPDCKEFYENCKDE